MASPSTHSPINGGDMVIAAADGTKLLAFDGSGHTTDEDAAVEFAAGRSMRGAEMRALAFYFASSIALTIFNKWFFSSHNSLGFHFPVTVTCVHQFLVYVLVVATETQLKSRGFGDIHRVPELRVPLSILGAACGIDWGLSNLSLRYIPLSLYEMTKSASPAMVLLVSIVGGLLVFTKRIATIVFLICMGMFLAVSGGSLKAFTAEGFPVFGFSCVVGATLISGSRIVYAQHALQRLHVPGNLQPGVNAITMLFYAAPASSMALVLPALYIEGHEVFHFFQTAQPSVVLHVAFAIVSSAWIAYALSLSEFLATRQTSALTLCVVGVTKQLLLIALAMAIFNDKLGLANVAGFIVALSGVSLYNYAKRTGGINPIVRSPDADLRRRHEISSGPEDDCGATGSSSGAGGGRGGMISPSGAAQLHLAGSGAVAGSVTHRALAAANSAGSSGNTSDRADHEHGKTVTGSTYRPRGKSVTNGSFAVGATTSTR